MHHFLSLTTGIFYTFLLCFSFDTCQDRSWGQASQHARRCRRFWCLDGNMYTARACADAGEPGERPSGRPDWRGAALPALHVRAPLAT